MSEPAFEAAPWHASRPEILFRALFHTGNGPPRLAPLARAILPRLPKRLLASQDLRSSSISSSTGLLDLDDDVGRVEIDCADEQRAAGAAAIVSIPSNWSTSGRRAFAGSRP